MQNVTGLVVFLLCSLVALPGIAQPVPVPTCGTVDDYEQPFDSTDGYAAWSSDEESGFRNWENIVDGGAATVPFMAGPVGTVSIWGTSSEFDGKSNLGFCSEDDLAGTPFDVDFYADDAGSPSAVPLFSTQGFPVEITGAGFQAAGLPISRYVLELAENAPIGFEWISVRRQTGVDAGNGNACRFFWVDERNPATYDNRSEIGAFGPSPLSDFPICLGVTDNPLVVPTTGVVGLTFLIGLLAAVGVFGIRRLG